MKWIVEAETLEDMLNDNYAFDKELIQCKDCKYWEGDYGYCYEQGVEGLRPDDYCCYAESREE